MKISQSWLSEYIDLSVPTEQIAQLLTDTGLEVEGVSEIETVPGGLKGLVIGEVLTCVPHENADRLKVTTVNIGTDEPLQIVCGAPNVEAGIKVVVSPAGTTIHPINGEPFKIKKGKIRGEVSNGMICAEDEIGLGKGHDGIMILETNAVPGTPAATYFGVSSDTVFEIGLTPNRVDGASHLGAARDLRAVKAAHDTEGIGDTISFPDVSGFKVDNQSYPIAVEVKNPDACPRYTAVTISGVSVKDSPDWLKQRLLSIGLTPINNVVDVTNFVLHEMGQPLHAFDADKIAGGKVIVKQLPKTTVFRTLDDVERKLNEADLMICNAENGMCIAGVFGGADSGVNSSTQHVFLESAYFNPVSVRKTAKRHGLNTDASFRYERGTDPSVTPYALKRAAMLIQELAGGQIAMDVVDVYPQELKPVKVDYHVQRGFDTMGTSFSEALLERILHALDFQITNKTSDIWKLEVPLYRVDVTRHIDVVEEVLRIYGYNAIPLPGQLKSSLSFTNKPDATAMKKRAAGMLTGKGFSEIMTNSLAAPQHNEMVEVSGDSIVLKNPLSSELAVMRKSLLPAMLESIRHNVNRRQQDLKLMEFGKTYVAHGDKRIEVQELGLAITGRIAADSWNSQDIQSDFFHLKGYVNTVLSVMGLDGFRVDWKSIDKPFMEVAFELFINKQSLGYIGKVARVTTEAVELSQDVFWASLNWEAMLNWAGKVNVKFKPVPKYPGMRRDLALLLDEETKFEDLVNLALKQDKRLLKDVGLFDVYKGKSLPEGKMSYALNFYFQDEASTLKDAQVDRIMKRIITAFEAEFKAVLR